MAATSRWFLGILALASIPALASGTSPTQGLDRAISQFRAYPAEAKEGEP